MTHLLCLTEIFVGFLQQLCDGQVTLILIVIATAHLLHNLKIESDSVSVVLSRKFNNLTSDGNVL